MTDAEIQALAERVQDKVLERVERYQEEQVFEAFIALKGSLRSSDVNKLADALGIDW